MLVALLFLFQPAFAEYRAFELVITTGEGEERVEISNLTPVQYRQYYPLPAGTKVQYRKTWMCRGNTADRKPVCPNPKP